MPPKAKLIILLYICLVLNCQETQANPLEERSARTKHDVYDWISSIFGDYDSDESEAEEYLICRNCTVIVGQANTANSTAAPPTVAPTPGATPGPTTAAAPEPTTVAAPGPTTPGTPTTPASTAP